MIIIENGQKRYFDRNGKEILEGHRIKYLLGGRIERVYRTIENELGIDATNPKWIAKGFAVPCEYGIYTLGREETEMVEVVGV